MINIEKEKLKNEIYNRAFSYEKKYGYCSQAVVAALQDFFPEIEEQTFKASQTLAGGGALCGGGSCGALAGGMLVIGSYFGRSRKDFGIKKRKVSNLARELKENFYEEFGSVICSDIQKKIIGRSFDLWNNQDNRAFKAAGAHLDKCPNVAGTAASITAQILLDEGIKVYYK